MNPRRNKKGIKKSESTLAEYHVGPRFTKPLPLNRRFTIGNASATIRYVDKIEDLVSSETRNPPIIKKQSPRRSTTIFSNLLKHTGIEPLAEMGDAMTGRH